MVITTSADSASAESSAILFNGERVVNSFPRHDVVKLTDATYILWQQQVKLVFDGYDLLGFLDGIVPPPPWNVCTADGDLALNPSMLVFKQDRLITSWLLSTIDAAPLSSFTEARSTCDVWNTASKLFAADTGAKQSRLRHELHSLKKGTLSVTVYVTRIKNIYSILETSGSQISDDKKLEIILAGLPPEFEGVVSSASLSTSPLSLQRVANALVKCETRLHRVTHEVSLHANLVESTSVGNGFVRGGRPSPRGRGKNFKPRIQCQICNRFGHLAQRCATTVIVASLMIHLRLCVRTILLSSIGPSWCLCLGMVLVCRMTVPDLAGVYGYQIARGLHSGYAHNDLTLAHLPRSPGTMLFGCDVGPASGSPRGPGLANKENYVARPDVPSGPITNHVQVSLPSDPCIGLPRVGNINASDYSDISGSNVNTTQVGSNDVGGDSYIPMPIGTSSWYPDSGASHHVYHHPTALRDTTSYSGKSSLLMSDRTPAKIVSVGSGNLSTPFKLLHLSNVLCVPSIRKNLLSVSQFTKDNEVFFKFHPTYCVIMDIKTKDTLLKGHIRDGLYHFPVSAMDPFVTHTKLQNKTMDCPVFGLWHSRLGHPSGTVVRSVLQKCNIAFNKSCVGGVCSACQKGKSHKLLFSISTTVYQPFELVVSDLWGPGAVACENKWYYSDWGREYRVFTRVLASQGIVHRLTCPYTSEQNGTAERKHRHIVEMGLTLLAQANLSMRYWGYTFCCAVHLINRLLFKLYMVRILPMTIYVFLDVVVILIYDHLCHINWSFVFDETKFLSSKDPCTNLDLNHGVTVSTTVPLVKEIFSQPVKGKSHKLPFSSSSTEYVELFELVVSDLWGPASVACEGNLYYVSFVDMYSRFTWVYLMKCKSQNGVAEHKHRHIVETGLTLLAQANLPMKHWGHAFSSAVHLINRLPTSVLQVLFLPLVSTNAGPSMQSITYVPIVHTSSSTPLNPPVSSPQLSVVSSPSHVPDSAYAAVRSDSDSPSATCLLPATVDISSGAADMGNVRNNCSSTPVSSKHFISLQVPCVSSGNIHAMVTRSKAGIFKPKVLTAEAVEFEPCFIEEALAHPDWKVTVQAEFDALMANLTWDLVPSPFERRAIGCKRLFKIKRNPDGSISQRKARLVAKGVLKYQVDVNNAFLNGDLDNEVFMQQPLRFVQYDSVGQPFVCRLKKALYGLQQALQAWFDKLKQFLVSVEFVVSKFDASLFIRITSDSVLYVLVYVDDIIITGNILTVIATFVDQLNVEFALKDMGDLHYFLGIEVTRSSSGCLHLCQKKYIWDLLARSSLSNAKLVHTPMISSSRLSKSDGDPLSDPTEYRSLGRALQYVVLTRPNIAYAVNRICQFMHNPSTVHMVALKRMLQYLCGTFDYGVVFHPSTRLSLVGYVDANWGLDADDRRFISGYCVYFGYSPIS
ncbi:hypothetical protein CXB51_018130 [Gossypium anomalum]|uniref:Integrase catalytic domain-containing protein n=1 Tax=Gossypium anomalum TaxID=47600 RepID=A0A8J5YE95_9ROSI|nr:hypothetical protein CXB51_018130 [Gossypium anomalum]